MSAITVALVGNPNTGKSTIFNGLTGSHQQIGNWAGVTVEKKVGHVHHEGCDITVVDLPGTYSANAHSAEERVVTDFLTGGKADLVLDIIDSTNLERNLLLTVQLLELGVPLMLDLNMHDEARRNGINIDVRKLQEALGTPVVQTTGRESESLHHLLDVFTGTDMSRYEPSRRIKRHMEQESAIRTRFEAIQAYRAERRAAGETGEEFAPLPENELDEQLMTLHYTLIRDLVRRSVTFARERRSTSDRVDDVLANGFMALPMFLLLLYGVFMLTFDWVGQSAADALGAFISGTFKEALAATLERLAVADWLRSLVLDGIVDGVGSVVAFVPLIFVLFFCLNFLEGTGYMARVAFVMDPVMRCVGLTGKAIMPLMMGFGCAVPAIMAARTLDNRKDRVIAMLVAPFLTCGAKLPVMALLATMFFPKSASNVVFSMYVIGLLMAVCAAKALGKALFKGEDAPFLLELPPYRWPDMRSVLYETWVEGRGYLVKAGTVIFAACLMVWFLSNFNLGGWAPESESFLASIGGGMAVLFRLHGFGTWQIGAAITAGVMAKEFVIATLAVLYGVGEAEGLVGSGIAASFTAASAYAFMVFSQLYTPCVTALATIHKETGSWRWTGFAALYTFAAAWAVSLLVYQVGRLVVG